MTRDFPSKKTEQLFYFFFFTPHRRHHHIQPNTFHQPNLQMISSSSGGGDEQEQKIKMTVTASGQLLRLCLMLLLTYLCLFQHDEIVVAADDDGDEYDDEASASTSTTTGTTVAASCQSSIDCHNDGICLKGDDKHGHYCSCLPGVSGGTFCEDTKCNLPCLNGGSCRHSYQSTGLPFPNDKTLTYVCECINGYNGVLCEITPSSSTSSSPTSSATTTTTTNAASSSETSAPATSTTAAGSSSGNSNPNHVQQVGGSHHTEGGQLFDANNNNNNKQNRCRHTLSHECQNSGVCVLSMDGNYCQCPHGTAGDHCEELFDVVPATTTNNSTDSAAASASSASSGASTTTTTESLSNSSAANNDDEECPTQCPPGTACVPSQYEFSEGRVETIYKCIVDNNNGSSSTSSQSQSGGGGGSSSGGGGGCPLPCMNGSSCRSRDDVQTSTLSYSCECPPGYRGNQCEVPYQLCPVEFDLDDNTTPPRRHECWHGGVCQLDDSNYQDQLNPSKQIYKCDCPPAYSGDRCEVLNQIPSSSASSSSSGNSDVSGGDDGNTNGGGFGGNSGPCTADDECNNGGLCVQVIHPPNGDVIYPSNYCQCPFGYGGPTCNQPCSLECHHGSSCRFRESSTDNNSGQQQPPGDAYCECVNSFIGPLCEIKYEYCPIKGDTLSGNNDSTTSSATQVVDLHDKCIGGGQCVTSGTDIDKIESSCLCPDTRTGVHCEFALDDLLGPSSSPSSSTSPDESLFFESVGLAIVLIIAVSTSVMFLGVWVFRRLQIRSTFRSKPTNDIEMTGDGIGIQLTKSEDTADNSTDGDWVNDNPASSSPLPTPPPQYATEVRSSWHEMMERAELELSEEDNDGNNNSYNNNTFSNEGSAGEYA